MDIKNCDQNSSTDSVYKAINEEEHSKTETENKQEETSNPNPLLGKEYVFTSSRGFGITGNARITSGVTIAQDRMHIEIYPKRRNVCPVVLFEDILAINITNYFAIQYLVMAALCAILGFFTIFTFVLVPLWIWLGMNKKIVISQRNGVNVTILEKSKNAAFAFKEDMRQLTKII